MTNYALTATAGAFGLTGNSATILNNHLLSATAAAFTRALQQTHAIYSTSLVDVVMLRAPLLVTIPLTLTQNVTFHEATLSYALVAGAAWSDQLNLSETQTPVGVFTPTLTDLLRITSLLQAGIPVSLQDTLNISQVLAVVRGATIADKLILGDQLSSQFTFALAILDGLKIGDTFANFFAATMADFLTMMDSLTVNAAPSAIVQDAVTFSDVASPTMLLRVELAETLSLSDAALLQAIFSGQLSDTVQFAVGYLSPGGGFTAWAANVVTNAVTEYRNWQFNSFARAGLRYLGANDQGIYELDGARDAGANIIADMRSGFFQMNGSQLHAFKAAYLAARGEGQFVFRLITGDGRTLDYACPLDASMVTTKLDLGKGIEARYFAFELISDGADFDLESVEFVPLRRRRRV